MQLPGAAGGGRDQFEWERSIWAPVTLATAVLSAIAARSLVRPSVPTVLSRG